MARHAHEFQCTHCKWYNYPTLSDTMHGNYTILCGECKHEHHRAIQAGVVTEVRHRNDLGQAERIHVPKSATQKTRREVGVVAKFRQLVAAGLVK